MEVRPDELRLAEFALLRFATPRLASWRFAQLRFARLRSAPPRFAPSIRPAELYQISIQPLWRAVPLSGALTKYRDEVFISHPRCSRYLWVDCGGSGDPCDSLDPVSETYTGDAFRQRVKPSRRCRRPPGIAPKNRAILQNRSRPAVFRLVRFWAKPYQNVSARARRAGLPRIALKRWCSSCGAGG